jgi:hypothetical protein
MANTNAPFGLRPVQHLDGSNWNGKVTMYYIAEADTNAYYLGDAVRSASGVAGDTLTGAAAVTLYGSRNAASTSGAMRGVVVGIGTAVSTPGGNSPQYFDPNNLSLTSIPATKSNAYYVAVVDDPDVVFEAQTDSLTGATYSYNAPLFVANAPTAPVVNSASYVQGSAAATTQAFPLKILGGVFSIDNELTGTAQYAKLLVKINQHELGNNTAGV